MRYWKYFAGVILFIALIVLLFWMIYRKGSMQIQNNYSLFSWGEEAMQEEEWDQLAEVLEEFQIQSIYQEVSREQLDNGSLGSFAKHLSEKNVDIYYLTGQQEWGLESDGASLIKEMESVWAYNKGVDKNQQVKGVMTDIEPYLTEEWRSAEEDEKVEYMGYFVDGMEEAYAYAKEKELELLVCIPTFYEAFSSQQLERLAANGCDGLAVMNYNRTDEVGQIELEVEFAKKYEKKIISIAELQKPGVHELEEINTYYEAGLPALKESWDKLEEWFQYEKLSFSYHYYTALKEMIKKES